MKFWTKFSRAAQAFDPAGVCDEWGAPSFAFCAKGGYHERMQWRSLGRSISKRDLGPALVHPHRANLFQKVETITAPAPLFRRFHESPFHRIAMHVPQLFHALLRGPHVEVVEAGLPEWLCVAAPWQTDRAGADLSVCFSAARLAPCAASVLASRWKGLPTSGSVSKRWMCSGMTT